jgi:hypothetical protein
MLLTIAGMELLPIDGSTVEVQGHEKHAIEKDAE